jgi:hypothetical protein
MKLYVCWGISMRHDRADTPAAASNYASTI